MNLSKLLSHCARHEGDGGGKQFHLYKNRDEAITEMEELCIKRTAGCSYVRCVDG